MEFINNKWNDWNIKNCQYLAGSSICATMNEDYLIFVGGYNAESDAYHQCIFVYDVRNKRLSKSNIKCPLYFEIFPIVTKNDERDTVYSCV